MTYDIITRNLLKFIKYRNGLLLFIVSHIYLLLTIPFSWLYYDVRYYYEWVDITWSFGYIFSIIYLPGFGLIPIVFPKGLLYIYIYATKASYPPLPILLFITTHSVVTFFTNNLQIIRLIDKLPLIIVFDLIYIILKKNYGWKASLLWLINSFAYLTIYNYHVDLFVSLFLLMSFIEFFKKKNIVKTSIYLAIASLFKPLVLVTAFIPLIILYRNNRFREAILFIIYGFLIGFATIAPYLIIDYRSFLYKAVFFHADRYPQEYSLWALPIYLYNYDISKIPFFIKYAWSPIYLFALIYIFYNFYREKVFSERIVVKYYLLILIVTYILNKIGNINYFVWCIPFLIIYTIDRELYRKINYVFLYIFIPLVLVMVAPITTFYSAYVVHGSVYIIEDLTYYSATDLTIKSIDPFTIQLILAEYFRTNAYWYFLLLYMGINVSYIVFSIIYNGYLIYILLVVFRNRDGNIGFK